MTKGKWWREAVVYQLYPRSFMDANGDGVGDLQGIIGKLDYLQWLGVDVIWLCPIYPSPNVDNGYDVSDYQAIGGEFGTMADFDGLLAEVHRRGMRLVLDLVINHTSDQHPWFRESRSSRDNPRRDWYIWRDGKAGGPPNNWESIFLGPAWTLDPATGQYYLHLFTAHQPDLNWENPALRAAVGQMVRWWLDKGVDGFRIDAVTHLKKRPGLPDMPNPEQRPQVPAYPAHMNVEGVLEFIDALCQASFQHYDVMTVGEANGVSARQAEAWVGQNRGRLSMLTHFEHWHLWSRDPHQPLDVRALKGIFSRWQRALEGRGWNALYLENTELPRVVSRWGDPLHYRYQSATALATLYFLMQGTPFIFQGQELGMANTVFGSLAQFDDVVSRQRLAEMRAAGLSEAQMLAELALTSRDNARTPMPWNAGPQGGFTTGQPWLPLNPEYPEVNVARQQADTHSVLHFYRRLIRLRRSERVLLEGRYRLLLRANRQIYAYTREQGEARVVVICNLSAHPATYRHGGFSLDHGRLLLANYPVPPHAPSTRCRLQPFEARVYRV